MFLADRNETQPFAVGHRVVHGGPTLRRHCVIDDAVLGQLETVCRIRTTAQSSGVVGHSVRSGAFSRNCRRLPASTRHFTPECRRSRAPYRSPWNYDRTVFGAMDFMVFPCESIIRQLGDNRPSQLIIAHLGNCVSITAVKDGPSVDTSMGLTPSGGVIMGTRCGDIDPGFLVYLAREKNFDAANLEALINRRSGLLGISGIDSDMRRLHEISAASASARLAIKMFCYSVRKQIATMIAALDGVEMLVFTGGIGEHDAEVCATICDGLSWLGASLEPAGNQSSRDTINHSTSRFLVRVLPSQEDAQIAVHTWELASGAPTR